MLLRFCIIFCQFHPGVTYKSVAYKTNVYFIGGPYKKCVTRERGNGEGLVDHKSDNVAILCTTQFLLLCISWSSDNIAVCKNKGVCSRSSVHQI